MFITDYFVICSGVNKRQLQSIADDIESRLQHFGLRLLGVEGYIEGSWILLDLGSVVVHLFNKEVRDVYDLELLWGDAPQLRWKTGSK